MGWWRWKLYMKQIQRSATPCLYKWIFCKLSKWKTHLVFFIRANWRKMGTDWTSWDQIYGDIRCDSKILVGERPIDFDPGMARGSWGESSRESCEHFEQPRQWQRQQSTEIFSVRWGRELEQVKCQCHYFGKFHASFFSRSASDSSVNHNKNLTSLSSQGWVITGTIYWTDCWLTEH